MTTQCGSMKTADAHTLGETADSNVQACNVCGTPDKSLLDEQYIVWTDANNIAHLSDECPDFEGAWKLMSAADAVRGDLESCASCGADRYLALLISGRRPVMVDATATPNATPSSAVTAAPSATPTAAPSPSPTAVSTATSPAARTST